MTTETQELLFKRLLTQGKLFGSRAFGCENETSDYDFILSAEKTEALMTFLRANDINFADKSRKLSSGNYNYIPNNKLYNTHNLKFILNDKIINIISYGDNINTVNEIIDSIHAFIALDNSISRIFKKDKEARIKIVNGFFNASFETSIPFEVELPF